MKEISTTQVYYAYFNENKDAIKAYKVIEEQPQNDVEMLFNVNVSIKAKDAKDAQRKLFLMLQMTSEKF